jgi:leucyl-tRNA synthetase
MFSFIIRQFDTFPPLLIDIHLALRQFHHDVRRFEPGIVGEIGADSERAADLDAKQIEEIAMSNEKVQEILAGATPKKIIIVPKKIINIVF